MGQSSAQIKAASSQDAADGSICAFGVIAPELSRVRSLIKKQLSDCNGTVRGLVSRVGFGRGKMIRPGLVILSGLACGGLTEEHIRTAAVIEMIHNATLLHDDVIDEAKTRRGRPTLNRLQGNESAVLLGDFLLSRVFAMWVGLNGRAAQLIASAAVRTCEGEIGQTAKRGDYELSEEQYIDIIGEKSAALFSGACAAGAALAGADEHKIQRLAEYGQNAGLAFQIADDLLDLTGKQHKTGKTIGNDLDRDKLTLPVIHFLKTAGASAQATVKKALARKAPLGANNGLLKKLHSCGSIEYAGVRAKEFARRAIAALAEVSSSAYKDSLIKTAGFIVSRTA